MMAYCLYLFLMLGFALANQYCYQEYGDSLVFELGYSHLFSCMEMALKNESTLLHRLNYGFMTRQKTEVLLNFNVQVKVLDGTNEHFRGDYDYEKAFCPSKSTEYNLELCSSLNITFMLRNDPNVEPVQWISAMHGSLLLIAVAAALLEQPAEQNLSLTLEIDELDCHPL